MKNIVLVIGNGFDLNLGFKTSYKDFYESKFCPKDYPAPLIKYLNSRWGNNLDGVKWYDFENELLNYYKKYERDGNVDDCVTDRERECLKVIEPYKIQFGVHYGYPKEIESLIKKGIIIEPTLKLPQHMIPFQSDLCETACWRDKEALNRIKDSLNKYIKQVSETQVNDDSVALKVLFKIARLPKDENNVNIYTFNYTSLPAPCNTMLDGCVHHVHGSVESGNIIIGTQDYAGMDSNYDFLQKSFDPQYAPPALVYDLQTADEVIIFGHSLGVNDRQYFNSFFRQQSSPGNTVRKKITIFTRDESSKVEIKRSLQQISDNNLAMLYGMNDLKIYQTKDVSELAHETDILSV